MERGTVLLGFLVVAVVAAGLWNNGGVEPVRVKPYVDGVVVRDSFGRPLSLRGFDVEPRDIAEEDMEWMNQEGFNTIRVMFFWHRFEPSQGSYSETYWGYLDNILEWAKKYKMYVMFTFHQWQWSPYFTYYQGSSGVGFPSWVISGGGYPDSAAGLGECIADFFMKRGHGVFMRQEWDRLWDYVVARYKDNPYLWAWEVFNEPLIAKQVVHDPGSNPAVMDTYVEFTERIRAVDAHTIIVYHSVGSAAPVTYPNIVWMKSWYDVAYGGYSSGEYGELLDRITARKALYNDEMGTPWIISEMGFVEGTSGGDLWIRDSFDAMKSVGINDGYLCYNWYMYHKGTYHGYTTPRNADGSNTFIVSILQEYA